MATVRKFTFDLDFDAPEPDPAELVEAEEEQEPEVVVPTFSEEDLERARKEGYDKGHDAGRREATEATEQKLLETVEAAGQHLTTLCNAQLEANQEIAKEMITVAVAIAKKMFPDLNARNALGEVERVVQETLKAITDEPRVQIQVPPELREPFMERLSTLTNRAGFDGKVFVNPDPSLNAGDCRVEWSNGAAVRDTNEMWEMVDEIVERNIYGPGGRGDDDAEAEHDGEPESAKDNIAQTDAAAPQPAAAEPKQEAAPDVAPETQDAPADTPEMTQDPIGEATGDAEQSLDNQDLEDQNSDLPDDSPEAIDDNTESVEPAEDGDDDVAPPVRSPAAVSSETQAAILDAQSEMSDDEQDSSDPDNR